MISVARPEILKCGGFDALYEVLLNLNPNTQKQDV